MPVAIVTGACSGIGLALSTHIHSEGWKVFMGDVRSDGASIAAQLHSTALASVPSLIAPTFVRTDVASFAAQAALFRAAFAHAGDISFFAANAGIDDREDIFSDSFVDQHGEPTPPAPATVDVNLNAVIAGLKLFVHYARKAARGGAGGVEGARRMVVTASMAGQYPFPSNPVYAATKHALVGLTRSVGKRLAEEKIYVSAIMPAFVPTNLAPPGLIDLVRDKGHITPMETVIRAYKELLAKDEGGLTVECSLDHLYYRQPVEYANDSQRVLIEDPEGWWSGAYSRVRESK